MVKKFKCEDCGSRFSTEKALEMHTKAKHPTEKKESFFENTNFKKIRNWTIVILVIVAIVAGFIALARTSAGACQDTPVEEMNIGGHQNNILHIHPQVTIRINGELQPIPPNTGISTSYMRPIHTHDSSGELHVEGPCQRAFTLGEFFDIWGKQFTNECIMGYCADENHTLTMYVEGQEVSQYRDLVLKDGQRIEIVYE